MSDILFDVLRWNGEDDTLWEIAARYAADPDVVNLLRENDNGNERNDLEVLRRLSELTQRVIKSLSESHTIPNQEGMELVGMPSQFNSRFFAIPMVSVFIRSDEEAIKPGDLMSGTIGSTGVASVVIKLWHVLVDTLKRERDADWRDIPMNARPVSKCASCGLPFVRSEFHPDQQYCSTTCGNRERARDLRSRRKKKGVTLALA